MAEAFTYCWTDTNRNMLYVGTHKGTPDDGYVCSGKLMLEEYNKRPQDFKREVIAFGSYNDMINFETKILKATNAAEDKSFYNQHNGDGNFFNKGHTEATRAKLKIARNKRTDKPNAGKHPSVEARAKLSAAAIKRSLTLEGKKHLSEAGKKSAEKRKNDPVYKELLSKKSVELWEKRRLGLLPWPKNMKAK
jgi:hypothetical protein